MTEIPGFSLLLKSHIFIARSEDAIFILRTVKISFLFDKITTLKFVDVETSSDLLQSSSVVFGNLRKMFGSVRLAIERTLENLRKVVGNLRKIVKTSSLVSLYNKTEYSAHS